jgi:hypothetical protein
MGLGMGKKNYSFLDLLGLMILQVWKSIVIKGATTGFNLVSETGVHGIGSLMVVDSSFEDTDTAIMTFPATNQTGQGTTGITLDNIKFSNVKNAVADNQGKSYLGADKNIDTWVLGRMYSGQKQDQALSNFFQTPRNDALTGDNPLNLPKRPYFERTKPQYTNLGTDQFVHMKDSCKGDGATDVTSCFQGVLNSAGTSKIVYIDAGSYILKDTITISKGARIVGETWAQLVASDSKFTDAK